MVGHALYHGYIDNPRSEKIASEYLGVLTIISQFVAAKQHLPRQQIHAVLFLLASYRTPSHFTST